jgi:hypothetical protein
MTRKRLTPENWLPFVALLLALAVTPATRGDDIDREPIRYATAPTDNAVSRLLSRLDAGEVTLNYEEGFGYLRSLLRELRVPESSQTLVFSKTSLQRHRIGPKSPRAIYFNEDVYVGFCQQGDVAEISAVDPRLGTVFYTLDQHPAARPKIQRQTDSCLICHASSHNQGLPGHLVRSVYPDREGYPELAGGSYRIDHRSPLRERWGGWYVSGTAGGQPHLGNRLVRQRDNPRHLDEEPALETTDLASLFDTKRYLTPHSDLVALLVLEHQAEMHNLIARATLETRIALQQETDLNRDLGNPADHRFESTTSRVRSVGEPLVRYLLFSGEPRLTAKVAGTSDFARDFARQGPHDRQGRSLHELDLRTRLFVHQCSYLIYSRAFDALPGLVKDFVLRRLWDVLTGHETGAEFAHLSAAQRRTILEILLQTKPGLPDYWKLPGG